MNAVVRAAADLQTLCEAQQCRPADVLGGGLDRDVRRQLTPLAELKEAPEILVTLEAKRREFDPA